MPSGQNWVNFVYVNVAFAIYIAGVFYYNQIAQIKANWPLYRCNPMYMFLADDINANFSYCIQSMQSNYMGYLLQPLTFITGSLTGMMSGFTDDIQNIRGMFNKIRTFFSSIVGSIFSVFLNLVIEFQRITIGIKDLIGKQIGVMVSLIYIMDGSIKTMTGGIKMPLVTALGKCFHPDTSIKLKDGTIKCMKDIDLGDILIDGSVVESVLKIDNKKERKPFYLIGENIYVTGSHLVFDKTINDFIKVENYSKAVLTDNINDWFSCLITDTHRIPIEDEIFWDWEDHFIKMKID